MVEKNLLSHRKLTSDFIGMRALNHSIIAFCLAALDSGGRNSQLRDQSRGDVASMQKTLRKTLVAPILARTKKVQARHFAYAASTNLARRLLSL
jgi:hypothetical protein